MAGTGGVQTITWKGSAIDIGGYFPDRGGTMPTIYLSRYAHQSGIHYRTEPPDEGGIRKTQGAAIERTFRAALGEYEPVLKEKKTLAALGGKSEERIKKDEAIGDESPPITVNRVNEAIFDAAHGLPTKTCGKR